MTASALQVIDRGRGAPTLVFLHYFAGSSASWDGVIDRLSPRWRCLAPDLPGFGRSPADPGIMTVAAYADEVQRLVRQHAIGAHVLVGHSMGGKIAALLASRRPPNLRGLVLLAPSPVTPEPITDADRTDLLGSHGDPAAARRLLGKIAVRPLSSGARAIALRDNLATSQAAWRWWLEKGSREDLSTLGALETPMLLAVGSVDRALPLPIHRATAHRLGVPRPVEVIADCGHLLPLEAAGEVARSIARFVEQLC